MLREHGESASEEIDHYASHARNPLMLPHDIVIQDVRVAFVRGWGQSEVHYDSSGFAVNGRGRSCRVRPDAYLAVDGPTTNHFLLEVDRSTETHAVIRDKLLGYRELRKTGEFSSPFASNDSPSVPFRVLFVCRSAKRRDNLAGLALSLHPPILSQAWFATIDDVKNDPRGAIWLTPHALRESRRSSITKPQLRQLIDD